MLCAYLTFVGGGDDVGGVMGRKKSVLDRVNSETDLGPSDTGSKNPL